MTQSNRETVSGQPADRRSVSGQQQSARAPTPALDQLLSNAPERSDLAVDGDVRLSSSELESRVATFAGRLRAAGVGRGDTVTFQFPNGLATHVLYRACWRLGAIAAPIHHLSGTAETELARSLLDSPFVVDDLSVLPPADPLLAGDITAGDQPHPDDRAVVLFTSGSTGRPKAVVHTHRTLAATPLVMVPLHGLTAADAVLMPAPAAHISGLLNGVLVPGLVPMKTVWMAKWDPDAAVDLIEREQISFMIGPPTFFVSLMHASSFDPNRVRSLRLVSCGGAGVTPAFVEEATWRLGARVKRTYGSTEAPTIASSGEDDDPALAAIHDGKATGDAELRLVDDELWVRGPGVCVGYLDDADTAERFAAGGWFRTGDLATIDHEGWLTIVGRMGDVIIRGGENIAAGEVEAVLEAHPAVRQAVAVGMPHERLGEQVCAFVVTTANTTFDLDVGRNWFAERGVAKFKTPERIVIVDALPLLSSGKPDRADLARRARTLET